MPGPGAEASRARAQWLASEMGMTEEEAASYLSKRKREEEGTGPAAPDGGAPKRARDAAGASPAHVAGDAGGAEAAGAAAPAALGRHLAEEVPAACMDKIAIVASHGCDAALRAARAVRNLRGMYVDDLRLWLQLMPAEAYARWLTARGLDDIDPATPYVAMNGTRILGGTPDILAHLAYWRGDKLVRDAGQSRFLTVIHLPCPELSSASVIIGDLGTRAAYIIDPTADSGVYLRVLEQEGLELKAVLLTHTPWDCAGGHFALRAATGCAVYAGRQAVRPDRERKVIDEELVFELSNGSKLKCLPTPGHTLDSVTYALTVRREKRGDPPGLVSDVEIAAFTGATLLVDTVGRTDVEAHVSPAGGTEAEMAEMLYESLIKITAFDADCTVFPARCGMQFSGHTVEPKFCARLRSMFDTGNHATSLVPGHYKSPADASKEAFLAHVERLALNRIPFPESFRDFHAENSAAAPPAAAGAPPQVLSLKEFVRRKWRPDAAKRAMLAHLCPSQPTPEAATVPLLVDVRPIAEYCAGHVKGSVSLPMVDGLRFEAFAAALVKRHADLRVVAIVSDGSFVAPLVRKLSLVGLGRFLTEVVDMSTNTGLTLCRLERVASDLSEIGESGFYLDVRSHVENSAQAVASAAHVPLESVKQWCTETPAILKRSLSIVPVAPVVTYCAGGYRSFIAATILNAFSIPSTDIVDGGLTVMTHNPALWTLKDPSIKCTS
ncbi:hypothetical protein DIPPA_13487 [Diplonema papillatum]|nr:hypothetical protein DIPPA_13487 [Diplonema papillatum]